MKPKELFYFVLYLVMIVSLLMTIGSRDIAEQADEDLINDMVKQLIRPPQVFVPDSTIEWDVKKSTTVPLIVLRAERPAERESLVIRFVGDGVAKKCSLKVDQRNNWSLAINPEAFTPKDSTFDVTVASHGIRELPDSLTDTTYELILEQIKKMNNGIVVHGDTVRNKYYIPNRNSETKFRVVARSLGEKKRSQSKVFQFDERQH